MRTISLAFREMMRAQETGVVIAVLLTISHPSLAEPIRLSSDDTTRISEAPLRYATISRGATYQYLPFKVVLPDDIGERAPIARIQVDNIDRALVELVRSTTTRATVSIEIVLASTPDTVETEVPLMQLLKASYDVGYVSLDLGIEALTDEPYPSGAFTPAGFPGLF